jgi:hypothetical protein
MNWRYRFLPNKRISEPAHFALLDSQIAARFARGLFAALELTEGFTFGDRGK